MVCGIYGLRPKDAFVYGDGLILSAERGGEGAPRVGFSALPPFNAALVLIALKRVLQFLVGTEVVVGFVRGQRKTTSNVSQLLCHGSDVVGLEAAAPANVSDAEVVRVPRELARLKPRDLTRLTREWKVRGVDPAIVSTVRASET